jgi:hypothetical protein
MRLRWITLGDEVVARKRFRRTDLTRSELRGQKGFERPRSKAINREISRSAAVTRFLKQEA